MFMIRGKYSMSLAPSSILRPHSPVSRDSPDRALIRTLAWDIVFNTTVPVVCYVVARWFLSTSEFLALAIATAFPLVKSGYDVSRRRELDPVTILVAIGLLTGIVPVFLGGDPRILLIRESFSTGAFGALCLLSLLLRRPLMFYFARYFVAGKDLVRRLAFNAQAEKPAPRRAYRLVTTAWGLVFVGEFMLRVALVYTSPAVVVLIVCPIVLGLATIVTIVWTFWYANRIGAEIVQLPSPTGDNRAARRESDAG